MGASESIGTSERRKIPGKDTENCGTLVRWPYTARTVFLWSIALSILASLPPRLKGEPGSELGSELLSSVYLLGTMRLVDQVAQRNVLPSARKTQAVLGYLCLSVGERLPRTRIAGLIWDRSGEKQARDSLRHALNDLDGLGTLAIEADQKTIQLDARSCWIDAFEAPAPSDLLLADLYGISTSFDQWLIGERSRFESRWHEKLETELKDLVGNNSAPELRAGAARKLLNITPTHEFAVRTLITAFVDIDERSQAIREYERFRQLMSANYGLQPSPTTTALVEQIRMQANIRRLATKPAKGGSTAEAPAIGSPHTSALPLSVRDCVAPKTLEPSIAVLPFKDLSLERSNQHVAEGLTEDLIELLSRVPGLFVTSRLSAGMFRHERLAVAEIGEALEVRYIVSGSLRVEANRLRLVVELTDARERIPLWTSRFDELFSDMLQVQDRLAARVVRSVAPYVRSAELKRIRIKRPEDQNAYDLLLRGQEAMHNPSRVVFESAGKHFESAIKLEPSYATALAWRAYWHVMRVGQGWSPDSAQDAADADRYAKLAIEYDETEPMGFAVEGHVATFLFKDFERAFTCFENALRLNPNCARAWLWSANAHAYRGDGAFAVEKVNRAMALSPYDPLVCAFSGGASLAHLSHRQYERSIEFALRCIRENRSYSAAYRLLIVALVQAGRENEARCHVHQLLQLEPGFTVEENRRRFPGSAWPFGEIYSDALARAGVPLSDRGITQAISASFPSRPSRRLR